MKTSLAILSIPLGVLALSLSIRTASAEEVAVQRTEVVKDQTSTTGPNRYLLHSGIWMLGLSYVPAVIVAAESSRVGDKSLYIPVAGPWMDLASRNGCPTNVSCNDTSNKVLIVIDGIFQGMGALNIVGAFIFPETRTVTVSSAERGETRVSSLSLRVSPAQVGAHTYGLAAVGTF